MLAEAQYRKALEAFDDKESALNNGDLLRATFGFD
jgi:hypothetical protein